MDAADPFEMLVQICQTTYRHHRRQFIFSVTAMKFHILHKMLLETIMSYVVEKYHVHPDARQRKFKTVPPKCQVCYKNVFCY